MEFKDIVGRYKQIKDFPDYYITEYGDIYSVRFRGKETIPRLRKLKPKNPGKDSKYLNIILCNDSGQFTKSIHRLVAEYFVDGYFDGAVVNHIDGNNRNNVATNLEWVTTEENIHKSYITSGVPAKRNYKIWELYDPSGNHLGTFTSHKELGEFVMRNNINASFTSLVKWRRSNGYTVNVREKVS